MRIYEDILNTSENRQAPRCYYIPKGVSTYTLLNGEWDFAYFDRDFDMPEKYTYLRFGILDFEGKHADTRAYFPDEIEK